MVDKRPFVIRHKLSKFVWTWMKEDGLLTYDESQAKNFVKRQEAYDFLRSKGYWDLRPFNAVRRSTWS